MRPDLPNTHSTRIHEEGLTSERSAIPTNDYYFVDNGELKAT